MYFDPVLFALSPSAGSAQALSKVNEVVQRIWFGAAVIPECLYRESRRKLGLDPRLGHSGVTTLDEFS
jgi:hypothetical protein